MGRPDLIRDAADRLADAQDADVLVYNGPLEFGDAETFLKTVERQPARRPAVFMVLVTYGGDAHVAYRIGRALQSAYKRVVVAIPGPCSSAGTLLAIAGHELVISDRGRLGPLDVQVIKPDEIGERSSGLTGSQALDSLAAEAFKLFESYLLELRMRSGAQITTKTASEVAANLTGKLFQPIYAQIDPMRLGEDERAMRIAREYGMRLAARSSNLSPDSLGRLVANYPSHAFVIDRDEATDLFNVVRQPDDDEEVLFDALNRLATSPFDVAHVAFVSTPSGIQRSEERTDEQQRDDSVESDGTPSGADAEDDSDGTGEAPDRPRLAAIGGPEADANRQD